MVKFELLAHEERTRTRCLAQGRQAVPTAESDTREREEKVVGALSRLARDAFEEQSVL